MGTTDCPETAVSNYQHTLGNIPEDRKILSTSGRKVEVTHL
jgi:hypothetical protein